jgi:integrase
MRFRRTRSDLHFGPPLGQPDVGGLQGSKRFQFQIGTADLRWPTMKRSYGSGRLFAVKHKSGGECSYGSWWAGTVRVKRKLGPKRGTGSSDGLTRVEAERELRRRMMQEVISPRPERRTLSQVGEEYVDHLEIVMERKRTTIEDYLGYLRGHFVPFFGKRRIDRIDADQVAAYLRRKLDDGYSSKTVQNHLNFLHGIVAFAVRRGWVTTNPVALVDRPKKNRSSRRRIRFLQPIELDRLISAFPEGTLGKVERPLYIGAALTGLRQGELLALRWRDIDWVASRIRVASTRVNHTTARLFLAQGSSASPIRRLPAHRPRVSGVLGRSCRSSSAVG